MESFKSLLFEATEALDDEVVKSVVDKGTDVNCRNQDGLTPLHLLASRDWCRFGFGPVSEAEQQRRNRIAEILLRARADPNSSRRIDFGCDLGTYATVLYEAVYYSNQALVAILLQHGADANIATSNGFTPLHQVLEQDNCDICIVKTLLKYGADPNTEYPGRTYAHHGGAALHLALMRDDCSPELIQLLKDHDADKYQLNARGLDPIECYLQTAADIYPNKWCIRGIDPALMSLLPLPRKSEVSPLHQACIFENADHVRLLAMQPGVDVNARDALNNTPLFYAITSLQKSASEQVAKVEGSGGLLDIAMRLPSSASEIYEVLVQHAAILVVQHDGVEDVALNKYNLEVLYANEANEWDGLCSFPKPNYAECIQELEEMTAYRLGDSEITFFDLLTADVKTAVTYAKNREIGKAYEACLCKGIFPIYQEWMRGTNFGKAYEERKIYKNGSSVLCNSLGFADPTSMCIEKMINFLDRSHVRTLVHGAGVNFENSLGYGL